MTKVLKRKPELTLLRKLSKIDIDRKLIRSFWSHFQVKRYIIKKIIRLCFLLMKTAKKKKHLLYWAF